MGANNSQIEKKPDTWRIVLSAFHTGENLMKDMQKICEKQMNV